VGSNIAGLGIREVGEQSRAEKTSERESIAGEGWRNARRNANGAQTGPMQWRRKRKKRRAREKRRGGKRYVAGCPLE
jgi:hypothetical protein